MKLNIERQKKFFFKKKDKNITIKLMKTKNKLKKQMQ